MKKLFVTGAALAITAVAGQAFAADLPGRRSVASPPPIMVPPSFTWTGFYAGVNAGFNVGRNDAKTVGTPGFVGLGAAVPASLRTGKDGFTGGGQIGYNQQLGMFIAGIEADLQYVDGKRATSFTSPALGGLTTTAGTETSYLGTLRARLGVTPVDRLMVYVTGGLAYGNPTNTASVVAAGPGALWSGSADSTRVGFAVGGGAEYALTNNWTARLEYMYYDLGRRTVTANPVNAAALGTGVAYQARFENTGQMIRAGVNYKF